MMRFMPTADFFSEEFASGYCAGLQYTVHDGNDKLAAAVQQWIDEGKVQLVTDEKTDKPLAAMGGAGLVNDVEQNGGSHD
jgi:hypothetical protein